MQTARRLSPLLVTRPKRPEPFPNPVQAVSFSRSGIRHRRPSKKGAVRCRVGAHSRTAPHPWWLLGRQVPRVRPPGQAGYCKSCENRSNGLATALLINCLPGPLLSQGKERFDTRVVVYLSFTSVNSPLYADDSNQPLPWWPGFPLARSQKPFVHSRRA